MIREAEGNNDGKNETRGILRIGMIGADCGESAVMR